jgi:hypothetical protein
MRTWTLQELIELSWQNERPTDPELLKVWKLVRTGVHYGIGPRRLKELVGDMNTKKEDDAYRVISDELLLGELDVPK